MRSGDRGQTSLIRRTVKGLSAERLATVMRGELRTRVLGEAFAGMKRQFRPEAAGQLKALIRWRTTGGTDEVFETSIESGTCAIGAGRTPSRARR